MAKKQKGISPDGTELLDFSSNPFPTYYRHQDGDKQVKMRGHVDQDDTEITIVLPRVSGSLAIIGDGGSIDLSDYYTKGEVESLINDLDVEIKNDYYDKVEIDKILADLDGGSDELQAQLDALEVLITKNTADISDNSMEISVNKSAISDNTDKIKGNEDAIKLNTDGINKNKKDISDLQAQINAGKDKASQYVWKEPSNYERPPEEGCLYAGNGVSFVDEIKLTQYLYMSKLDDEVVFHNLEAIEKGDVIEADLGGDHPAHGVFEVDSVEMISDTYARIKVITIRSAGNWSDQNRTSDVDSWSISFMLGLEVEASNYYSKNETDNLFTPITTFDDHEKRNVASFALIETELFRVAKEVILNFNGILINEDAIKENTKAIEEKASKSEENIFNAKQTFNKNVTFKGAETALIPPLSSRWHKYTVNPPKNAEGGNDTSEAYGVNYYLDAGNTWKNQFKISNRNGTAFEVRGGSDMSGQLHSKWTYTGTQEEDNDIATVKYVKDAVGEGGASSTGYPPLSEYDFYYLDMPGTTAGRITLHDYKGVRTTDLSKVTLVAFSGVDKNGKRWARDAGAVNYEKEFTGVLNLMTEEGKTVLKMGAGKGTGYANLYYFKDAIEDFVPDDCYLFEVIGGGGIQLTSDVTEVTYPQKLHLHVSGLHY